MTRAERESALRRQREYRCVKVKCLCRQQKDKEKADVEKEVHVAQVLWGCSGFLNIRTSFHSE